VTVKLPARTSQALKAHIAFIEEGLAKEGAPDDLGELFDGEDETFHKYLVLQDSSTQFSLGFVDAIALVRGVAPETMLKHPAAPKKPKPKAKPKRKTSAKKAKGQGADIIQLHRGR
jgi:hypothetical protein